MSKTNISLFTLQRSAS